VQHLDLDGLVNGGRDNAVDVDAGEVDIVRVDFADGDNLLGLDDADCRGFCNEDTECLGSVALEQMRQLLCVQSSHRRDV